jgi:pilus assembly protein Flp/PilA
MDPEGLRTMAKLLAFFLRNESGATAIEYGLIAAGVSIAIVAAVQLLGTTVEGTFSSVSSALK